MLPINWIYFHSNDTINHWESVYDKFNRRKQPILTYYKWCNTVNNKNLLTQTCRRHVQRLSACALSFWQRWSKTCAQTRFDQFVVKFSSLYRTRAKEKPHNMLITLYTEQNRTIVYLPPSLWTVIHGGTTIVHI